MQILLNFGEMERLKGFEWRINEMAKGQWGEEAMKRKMLEKWKDENLVN